MIKHVNKVELGERQNFSLFEALFVTSYTNATHETPTPHANVRRHSETKHNRGKLMRSGSGV